MKFLINSSSEVSCSSLHLKISGFSIELSDISSSEKIAVAEDSGKISIEVLPVVEVLPIVEALPGIEDVSANEAVISAISNEQLPNDVQEVSEDLEEPLQESGSGVQDISPDEVFKRLVALRRQISQEVKLPPYIIFHDTTLKDMVSKMPVDLDEMKEVSGVGISKLEKYGERFVEAIRECLAVSA